MNYIINKEKWHILLLFCVGLGSVSMAAEGNTVFSHETQQVSQQTKGVVKGVVTDQSGETIIGANVKIVGSTNGTISDAEGNFELSNVAVGATLQVSFIGYTSISVKVQPHQSFYTLVMKEESEMLNDVVVIGYGTIKKSDVSGSVSSIDKDEMMKRNPMNLAQGLQGAAAGVMVSKHSGDPEGDVSIRIRGVATINGSADPLYVVDGVQVGTDANFINPSDVESIEILKDASATAIYGARGANGVILITTKKGSGTTKVNFTANFGVQNMTGKLDVANAEQFAASVRDGRTNDQTSITNPAFGTNYIGKLHTIDWQDVMTHTALQQNYNLSASGGNKNTQSTFSLGYLNNDGVVLESNYTRLTARASVTQKVKDFMELGGSLSFLHGEKRGSGSLRDYAILTPTMDYVDDEGNFISHNYSDRTSTGDYYAFQQVSGEGDIQKGQDNPYAVAMQADHTPTYTNTLLGIAYLDLKLFKGFSFHSTVSYKYLATDESGFDVANNRSITESGTNSFSLSQNQKNELGIENYFTYNWENDVHNVTLMAGSSVSNTWGHWVSASANNFLADTYRSIDMTSDQTSRLGSGGYDLQSRYISYYCRAMYSLLGRYIITGTVRHDGSSNFGPGNRWGTFPSAAFAWRASEEDFIKNLNIFSNLKLRLGWGITGNAGSATDLSVAQLSSNRIAYYMGSLGGTSAESDNTLLTGVASLQEIDTNLKWESNKQTNIGLDMGFFNNSLNLTMDYFVRDSKNLLLYRTMRPSTGHSSVYTNAGHVRNSGFELSLNYNKSFGDWKLAATLTGSTLKNKAISVGDPIYTRLDANGDTDTDDGDQWNTHSVTMNGHPVGAYYGYVVDGIWQSQSEINTANAAAAKATSDDVTEYQTFGGSAQPGDYKYKDVNGDGHITSADQTVLGDGFPSLNYGLTLNASYKNFDAMVYMYGVSGMKIYSYAAMKLSQLYKTSGGIQNTLTDYLDNAWSSSNTGGKDSRLTIKDENYNRQQSSAWVKNGDFLKIANIQVGYTLPENLIKKVKMDHARIYVSVENLCTFSSYNKYGDPEVGNTSVLETGFDGGRYPYPRTFTAGIQIQF